MEKFDRQPADDDRPMFAPSVPTDGYRWWYVDGISDDGRSGVVVIAFIGSVFSPYYFKARKKGPADPFEHCSINVALYDRRHGRWCMTERNRKALDNGTDHFRVAATELVWRDDALQINVNERSTPTLRRVTGSIRLHPTTRLKTVFSPDSEKRHIWQPIAPIARVELDFPSPGIRWQGCGYFDTNAGVRPLEKDFWRWSWSRGGSDPCSIDYHIEQRDGVERELSVDIHRDGRIIERERPDSIPMKSGLWRVNRYATVTDAPTDIIDLEDTPFYTRSILNTSRGTRMHEFLDLDRFSSRWVQTLLPFRMPRIVSR